MIVSLHVHVDLPIQTPSSHSSYEASTAATARQLSNYSRSFSYERLTYDGPSPSTSLALQTTLPIYLWHHKGVDDAEGRRGRRSAPIVQVGSVRVHA